MTTHTRRLAASPGRPSVVGNQTDRNRKAQTTRFGDSERWRDILDVAAKLFAVNGYEATSVQQIADGVGITKGSMYHYIESKDDLLFHVLIEIHDIHLAHFDEYAQTPGGPLERLRAFIEGHVRVNIADIERGSIFYLNFESLSKQRRELILRRRRKFDQFLRQLLTEGQAAGTIRKDLDVRLAAIGILTSVNSMYLWWDPSRPTTEDVPGQFADLFLSGVVAPSTDQPSSAPTAKRRTARSSRAKKPSSAKKKGG